VSRPHPLWRVHWVRLSFDAAVAPASVSYSHAAIAETVDRNFVSVALNMEIDLPVQQPSEAVTAMTPALRLTKST